MKRERFEFAEPTDARHFHVGETVRGAPPEWGSPMAVVDAIDVAAGVVTLRQPTWWERVRYRLSFPWRWLRWRFGR